MAAATFDPGLFDEPDPQIDQQYIPDAITGLTPAAQKILDHPSNRLVDPKGTVFRDTLKAATPSLVWPGVPISIGTRTLADLPYGPPEPQLLDPFLTPDGTTIIYGKGNVGKGMLSIYFACRLVRAGNTIMIVDYEHHEREWGNRARRMGFSEKELRKVHYRAPFGQEWTAKRGALLDVADLLRVDCDALDVQYLIVDSYTAATSTGDAMGGAAGAQEFYEGLTKIGRPNLVIAHVAGASQRFPDKPFGSVFVHNFARETWAVESLADEFDEQPFDPSTHNVLPTVMPLELRNKKLNTGSRPRPQFISFSFFPNGNIDVDQQQPKGRSYADLAEHALSDQNTPRTIAELIKDIREDTGETLQENSLRKALEGNPTRFAKTAHRPHKYSLRESK